MTATSIHSVSGSCSVYQPKRVWRIQLFGYHKGRRELLVCDSGCSVPVNHALGIHCHALVSQTDFHCISGYAANMA